ncbi:helix-turn-helix domain-containing protein [Vibrio sp. 1180_3]|uniref:helix-turn-helix domain-containing protein n=1 Tax=Vibrio sp. 1180_3 TaxID=2528832 RepID=UPI002405C7E2|nr:helix-turn-helix domain-containing protein [Vibrio sp. 1180_3]MDF9399724.1 hypothetical protein [Vibrio sp. 1180_3]
MHLKKIDLQIVKRITELEEFSVDFIAEDLQQHKMTVYRSIQRINDFISKQDKTSSDIASCHPETELLNYEQYLQLFNDLTVMNYRHDLNERSEHLLFTLCLKKVLNKKKHYEAIKISLSSLKNDSLHLQNIITKYGFSLVTHKRKGTQLVGNETIIRSVIVNQLSKIIQLDEQLNFKIKSTITPLNRVLAEQFIDLCNTLTINPNQLYLKLREEHDIKLSYNSRKFILLYVSITLLRFHRYQIIAKSEIPSLIHCQVFTLPTLNKEESLLFSKILACLTYKKGRYLCFNSKLLKLVRQFSEGIQSRFVTTIINQYEFNTDIYELIESTLIRQQLGIHFIDKKLEKVIGIEQKAYLNIAPYFYLFEDTYALIFDDNVIATLILIIKKHTERNKSTDRQRKRLCFITNSSENKLGYLFEKLKTLFHVELTEILDINEISRLKEIQPDAIVCFTHKIEILIKKSGHQPEKLKFNATHTELQNFGKKLQLSRASRKIPMDIFLKEIEGKTKDEIKYLLNNQYSSYFI